MRSCCETMNPASSGPGISRWHPPFTAGYTSSSAGLGSFVHEELCWLDQKGEWEELSNGKLALKARRLPVDGQAQRDTPQGMTWTQALLAQLECTPGRICP